MTPALHEERTSMKIWTWKPLDFTKGEVSTARRPADRACPHLRGSQNKADMTLQKTDEPNVRKDSEFRDYCGSKA